MAFEVGRESVWIKRITPEQFADKDLIRIITFFVFHSPCENVSAMGKAFREYGWSKPWGKPCFLNKQLKEAATAGKLIYAAKTYDEMEIKVQEASLDDAAFPSGLSKERICAYVGGESQIPSVFRHLRNSFCHGRFAVYHMNGEEIFAFEDVKPGNAKLKLSARMVLRKSTLLRWIEIIENGEQAYKKPEKKKQKSRK